MALILFQILRTFEGMGSSRLAKICKIQGLSKRTLFYTEDYNYLVLKHE